MSSQSPPICDNFLVSPYFLDLGTFEEYWSNVSWTVPPRMFVCCLVISLGLWIWRKATRDEVPLPWHHTWGYMISPCLVPDDGDLDHLVQVVLDKFLQGTVPSFFFPSLYSWKIFSHTNQICDVFPHQFSNSLAPKGCPAIQLGGRASMSSLGAPPPSTCTCSPTWKI